MGVDGVKPKIGPSAAKPVDPKTVEPVRVDLPLPLPAKKPLEGFDLLKKKLMSISGRYAAPPPTQSERADLHELIAGHRSLALAQVHLGAPPAARAAEAPTAFDASRLTDSTRNQSAQVSAKSGAVVPANKSGNPVKTPSGRIPAADWENPPALVSKLTQHPKEDDGLNANVRCGPANLLAAQFMQGPEHAANFLDNVAASAEASTQLTPAEAKEMRDIAGRIRNHTATYEDVNQAQNLLYKAGNVARPVVPELRKAIHSDNLSRSDKDTARRLLDKPQQEWTEKEMTYAETLIDKATGTHHDLAQISKEGKVQDTVQVIRPEEAAADQSGLYDGEAAMLAGTGTGRAVRTEEVTPKASVGNVLAGLGPGQSATIRVAGTENGTESDHFVTVGRTADGTPYIYNPDPSAGDTTLYLGKKKDPQPKDFNRQLKRYDERCLPNPDSSMPTAIFTDPAEKQ